VKFLLNYSYLVLINLPFSFCWLPKWIVGSIHAIHTFPYLLALILYSRLEKKENKKKKKEIDNLCFWRKIILGVPFCGFQFEL